MFVFTLSDLIHLSIIVVLACAWLVGLIVVKVKHIKIKRNGK